MQRKFKAWIMLIALGLVIVATAWAATTPQQNISGGGSTSIVQGGNTATVSASGALKTDANITNASIAVTPSGTFNVTVNSALPSGTNTIGTVKAVSLDGCGGTNYDSGLISVPSSNTAVTATNTCVHVIQLLNITASQQTCTVTDGQGSPVTVIASYDIPAKSAVRWQFDGVKFLSGVKWSCTAAASVVGYVRGAQ